MKNSFFVALITVAVTLPAFAQDKKDLSAKVTKTKITCSFNSDYSYKDESNPKFSASESDKSRSTVSIRTTRYENGVEYRDSEFQGLDEKGRPYMEGNFSAKVVTEKAGDKIIESSDTVLTSRLLDDRSYQNGKKTNERVVSTRVVYQMNGNQRVLLSFEEDGVSLPTRGEKTSIFHDEGKRIENSVIDPHTEKHGSFLVHVSKEQSTCIFEDIK